MSYVATDVPTAQPTDAPVTPSPSKSPITSSPSKSPSLSPTPPPVECSLFQDGDRCRNGEECCSGLCSGGKPSARTCLPNENGPTTPPGPTTPSPTPGENTPAPQGLCLDKNAPCGAPADCCSDNCKNNGRCSGL